MNLEDSRKRLETEVSLTISQGHLLFSFAYLLHSPLMQTEFFGVVINLYMTSQLPHLGP